MHAVYQCLLPFFLFHYSFKRSFSPRISLTTSLSFLNYRYNDPTSQCSFFFSSFLPFPSFAQRFQTKSINDLNFIQPCILFLFLSLSFHLFLFLLLQRFQLFLPPSTLYLCSSFSRAQEKEYSRVVGVHVRIWFVNFGIFRPFHWPT